MQQRLNREHLKLRPKHWLQAELGEGLGAVFMISLWAIVFVALIASLLVPFIRVYSFQFQSASGVLLDLVLPLALVLAGLHQIVTQSQAREQQVVTLALVLGLAVVTCLIPSNLLLLPRLLGADV